MAEPVTVDSTYLLDVAVPILFIGAGQGLPSPPDLVPHRRRPTSLAGASSELLNTAHQLGTYLGLAIVVTANASPSSDADTVDALANRVGVALGGASVMLALATLMVAAFIPVTRAQALGGGGQLPGGLPTSHS